MTVSAIDETVRRIVDLYEKHGTEDYIGESVSQIEHMCQCAQMAEAAGYDEEVILAAFFHDIGHLLEHIIPTQQMNGFGVADHEKNGADYLLKNGFSHRIAKLVASHVNAKRYLTLRYPGYYDQLSEASKKTLDFQGGVMTEQEAKDFESDPSYLLYLQLRRWDEQAKEQNLSLPPLDHFRDLMTNHLADQHKSGSKSIKV